MAVHATQSRDGLRHEDRATARHTADVITGEFLEIAAPALDRRRLVRIPVLLPFPRRSPAGLAFATRLQEVRNELRPVLRLPAQQIAVRKTVVRAPPDL